MKGNGQKKNGNGKIRHEAGAQPWYIRSVDTVDLVYRHDPAVKKFPKQDTDAAPIEACTIREGQAPAVFVARPLTNREHLGMASLSIRGIQEDKLHEQYLAAAFEIAQMCITEIRNPDGSIITGDEWREVINQAHPGLVVGLGLWILGESTWDPVASKKKPQQPRTSIS
mgnify:CR=1 FL=1